MIDYGDLHARYYDVIYADKRYDEEARFVDERIRDQGNGQRGRLLDVACGTGRHCRAFARLGWSVVGVDRNPALLELARAAAEDKGPDVEFVEQDMRKLALDGRFDAVTCLFDSIGYPVAIDEIRGTLRAMHEHLSPGGVAVIEFLNAITFVRSADPVRVRRWSTPTGSTLMRVSETEVDTSAQTMEVDYTLVELRADGTYSSFGEHQRNRLFTADEMRLLLETTGFDVHSVEPAYEHEPTSTGDAWHLLAVAVPASVAARR